MTSRRLIVILLVPPVRELDLVGILDVFSTANTLLPPDRQYLIEIANAVDGPEIAGMCGLKFSGAVHFSKIKGEIDTLLVPGGIGVETTQPGRKLIDWLRKKAAGARRTGSVCTGAFLMAHCGLFDGRRVTTHWAFAAKLARRFPAVRVDPDPIWVRDGNFYSSAGVTSGIDLSLALLEEDHGRKIALAVARTLVVFLCRPGNQAQFSASLREQITEPAPLRDLQIWMVENLKADLSIPALAARVAMSERNFQRVFTRETGSSPARYAEEIRIEAVRGKLERTGQSMDEIASACGYGSADVMARSFLRRMQVSPADYRSRFRTSGA